MISRRLADHSHALAESFLCDVRIGLRLLARSPGLTATAVFTLAVGIGLNTAVFSMLHTVVVRPLPFPEPHRLVQIVERNPARAQERGWPSPDVPVSLHNYDDYRERNT